MRVLVTGGSGLLGRRTIAALAARGHEVVALQRRQSPELACRQVLADVCDRPAVAAAAAGCDAAVHGAARVGVVGTREEFRRANVGGTESVVAACREAGVPRLVVVSSPSVGYESVPTVGAGAEAPITARGDRSWYSESKGEAELVALAANGPALAVTAIRPHAIWGPGDTQLVGRIVERARAGRLFVVAGGRALIDTTYVDNAADALVAAAEQLTATGALAGRAFVVSNGEPLPVRVLLERICAAAGVPPPTERPPPGRRPPARRRCRAGLGPKPPCGRAAGDAVPRRPARPRPLVRPAPVSRGDGLAARGQRGRGDAQAGGLLRRSSGRVVLRGGFAASTGCDAAVPGRC